MKIFAPATIALLLLLEAPSLVNGVDFGGGDFGKAKFCPPYRCRKGEEPVPKWPLKLTSPGCAGMGGLQMFGGGGGEDENEKLLTGCCDLRHACHQTCGSIKTICDEEFNKCLENKCATEASDKEKCDSSAGIYKLMVQMDNSCQRFDAEQYAHCECAKEGEDVADKREKVLQKFYKKFNPDSIKKVPNLAMKADNSRKMATLLQKLYKKYPQVIKRVKDPQQEEMERMMKEAKEKRKDGETTTTIEEEDEDDNVEDLGTQEL